MSFTSFTGSPDLLLIVCGILIGALATLLITALIVIIKMKRYLANARIRLGKLCHLCLNIAYILIGLASRCSKIDTFLYLLETKLIATVLYFIHQYLLPLGTTRRQTCHVVIRHQVQKKKFRWVAFLLRYRQNNSIEIRVRDCKSKCFHTNNQCVIVGDLHCQSKLLNICRFDLLKER